MNVELLTNKEEELYQDLVKERESLHIVLDILGRADDPVANRICQLEETIGELYNDIFDEDNLLSAGEMRDTLSFALTTQKQLLLTDSKLTDREIDAHTLSLARKCIRDEIKVVDIIGKDIINKVNEISSGMNQLQ